MDIQTRIMLNTRKSHVCLIIYIPTSYVHYYATNTFIAGDKIVINSKIDRSSKYYMNFYGLNGSWIINNHMSKEYTFTLLFSNQSFPYSTNM